MPLSWRDGDNIVHAMYDDWGVTVFFDPAANPGIDLPLLSACEWGHDVEHSALIRMTGGNEPVTCLACLTAGDEIANPEDEPALAPCCNR